MTTIAYDYKNKIIAYDSRLTAGTLIVSDNHNKHRKCKRGWDWVISATEHDTDQFIDLFAEQESANLSYDVDCVVVIDSVVFNAYVNDGLFKLCPLVHSECFGSGGRFALAALDFGKSAKDAIKYAMKRDSATGGKIRILKL